MRWLLLISALFATPVFADSLTSAVPYAQESVLAASAVPASVTGTATETTLASVRIPANTLGPNGRVRVTTTWSAAGSTNLKTLRVHFGATNDQTGVSFSTTTMNTAAAITARLQNDLVNRGATNSQYAYTGPGFAGNTTANVTSTVDTTADSFLVFTGQLTTTSETVTLESYLVEVVKP